MANTYTLIEGKTLGTTAASVTFSSIPATYTDILVKISTRSDRADIDEIIVIKPNNSTTGLTYRRLRGNGSVAASSSENGTYSNGNTTTSNTFNNAEIYFPNYTSSNNKSYSIDAVMENNATEAYMALTAGLWSDTSAITSLVFAPNFGTNFVSGSTFYLYGIKNS